jgi:hypothetical protein
VMSEADDREVGDPADQDHRPDERHGSHATLFYGECRIPPSGAEGARTPDLRAASATLFQLSYSPGKLVIGRGV